MAAADKRQSGKFRHSVFISDTFEFLDDFEEENDDANTGTKTCIPAAADFTDYPCRSDVDGQDVFADGKRVVYYQKTKGGVLNTPGTLESVTNIESNSRAEVNGNDSHGGSVPNGNRPSEDRTGGHIDYSFPSRLDNTVNGTSGVSDDGANENSRPVEEFSESGQNGSSTCHKTCSGLITNSSMPGCHGNGGVGDELRMGTLTEGKTNGVGVHLRGIGTDTRSDALGTMCAENMDGPGTNSVENSLESSGKCAGMTKSATDSEKGLPRSMSTQDKHVLSNGKNDCDNSGAASGKITGSVSMPGNLQSSRGPTVSDDVSTKSDDVIEKCAKDDDVLEPADQNCDEKLKGEVTLSDCDSESNGSTGGLTKNGVLVRVNGDAENVESSGVKNVELNGTKSVTAEDVNSDDSGIMKRSVDSDLESEVKVVLRRSAANSPSRFSESSSRGTSEDEDEDEDAGVYAETHRYSHWVFEDEEGKLRMTPVIFEDGGDGTGSSGGGSDTTDDAFIELNGKDETFNRTHRRLESQSSTASEREFKRKYQHVSRKMVKRKSSLQAYERLSERICEPEHEAILTRETNEQDYGFHIKNSKPSCVSTVVPGSIAALAGVQVGEIIVSVNGVNCMEASHDEVLELLLKEPNQVVLELSKPSSNPDDASQEPIMTGFLMKQCGTGLLKTWRKRYFVLKRDHCLYYYKDDKEKDPIGAILLSNYMITKSSDGGLMGRKHAFKAVKYSAKTYYFAAESESEMINWANALNELAKSAGRTDTWLDISSRNVDIPALSIKNPDCHGNLCKLGIKRRHWRRRYCVLKDACIYYYLDVNANTAQGVAHLHGYKVLDSSPQSRKFTFTLQPPEDRMRTFYFSAENETDLHRWTASLRKSIGRWQRTD